MAGLKGRSGRRCIREMPPAVASEPPSELLKEIDTQGEWLFDFLRQNGKLEKMDTVLVNALCAAYGLWVRSYRRVMREGAINVDHRGNSKISPAAELEIKYSKRVQELMRELQLTPATRQRISAALLKSAQDAAASAAPAPAVFVDADPGEEL